MASDAYTRWTDLPDNELSTNDIQDTLAGIQDDLWVTSACVDRLLDDAEVQRTLLELGIQRTAGAVERGQRALIPPDSPEEQGKEEVQEHEPLASYFREAPDDAKLCHMRVVLLQRLDRLNTYVELCKEMPDVEQKGEEQEEALDEWDDDPWGEESGEPSTPLTTTKRSTAEPPISLSLFLENDLLPISCLFASLECYGPLRVLLARHSSYLWPSRFTILNSVPEHAHPSDYRDLMPNLDPTTNIEIPLTPAPLRSTPDWSETPDVRAAIETSQVDLVVELPASSQDPQSHPEPASATELAEWYKRRVDYVISSTGMVDIALATIQHGASQGIPHLDELGEKLSLLARLVYDTLQPEAPGASDDWTLDRWNAMDPAAVVRAYLAHSTPTTVSRDIQRLVMPYLFVLESHAERAGQPDPGLPNRMLYEYILTAPLDLTAAIFEASKPTLPPAQRLIRSDEDIARLALACLYGSDRLDQWPTMSSIFECLPAWDITRNEDQADEADTTIASLGAFVTPSTTRPRCTASDLLVFFKPLPISSLSRALDILDIHLESGEILARRSVPAPLRWFLQSNGDANEQRAWANRMARRAGGTEDRLNTREDWDWLLGDMLKLNGTGDNGLKGAFGLVPRREIIRIFFSGLLSTGKFDIAKDLLRSSKNKVSLDAAAKEDICLAASRELYDNASSGNYKFGDMKLAYDCLDVPPPSEQIIKEKEFIEATSRISSFNVMSRPGIPISPIEIRLTKDRLSLVSRVLSSNADAYKHTQVILDLANKLGFRGDVPAEVKTLAMLANTALHAEDFDRAYETSERMVDTVIQLQSSSPEDLKVQEAIEVCWMACWQLGRQPEFEDVDKKLLLLGRSLELCPPERLYEVLTVWSRLEKDDLEHRKERLANPRNGVVIPIAPRRRAPDSAPNTASSISSRLQDFRMHMPSSPLINGEDAAALAGRTLGRVTAHFPFSVGRRDQSRGSNGARSGSREPSRTQTPNGGDLSAQASSVFGKGIGWLIGADDE
ncbi:Sec39-domain-containing protein [Athelia psychrophila]|uniref:Sec39-domain-containing protein n=1 Tax=Athelia psychrophila TaxID=1759441 RepID=A0A165ZFB3_9AGAM|nr:Sec39-domain-containing protein [Fibularhizoctonia sp. CBS 109695]